VNGEGLQEGVRRHAVAEYASHQRPSHGVEHTDFVMEVFGSRPKLLWDSHLTAHCLVVTHFPLRAYTRLGCAK